MVAPLISTASLYHWLPVAEDEVNNTDPPLQNVVGPPGVIVGVDGIAFTVIVIVFDVAGLPVAQVAFEVNFTLTASPLTNVVEV